VAILLAVGMWVGVSERGGMEGVSVRGGAGVQAKMVRSAIFACYCLVSILADVQN